MERRIQMGKIWITCVVAVLCMVIAGGTGLAEQKSETYILNISVIGSGRIVGKNIECSAVCNITLPAGTEVVLTAFPASEWSFAGWESACKGKGACNVALDGDKAVEAIFTYP
jgi:hypothetical protein